MINPELSHSCEWTLGHTNICTSKVLILNGLMGTLTVPNVQITVCLMGLLGYICRSKVLTLNGLLGTQTVPIVMMTVCLMGLLGLYLQE